MADLEPVPAPNPPPLEWVPLNEAIAEMQRLKQHFLEYDQRMSATKAFGQGTVSEVSPVAQNASSVGGHKRPFPEADVRAREPESVSPTKAANKRPRVRVLDRGSDAAHEALSVGVETKDYYSVILDMKPLNSFSPFPRHQVRDAAASSASIVNKASRGKPMTMDEMSAAAVAVPPATGKPNATKRDASCDALLKSLKPVLDEFTSTQQYADVFQNLLLEETVEQIKTAMDTASRGGRGSSSSSSSSRANRSGAMHRIHAPITPVLHKSGTSKSSSDFSTFRANSGANPLRMGTTMVRFLVGKEVTKSRAQRSDRMKAIQRSAKRVVEAADNNASAGAAVQSLGLGDLVVISRQRSNSGSAINNVRELLQSESTTACFAFVAESRFRSTYMSGPEDNNRFDIHLSMDVRVSLLERHWVKLLGPKSPKGDLWMWKVANLVTSQREYDAVAAAVGREYFPLRKELLSGNTDITSTSSEPVSPASGSAASAGLGGEASGGVAAGPVRNWNEIPGFGDGLITYLGKTYNPSQLGAIEAAARRTHGFTLVQGPPGTGKTTTLLGIINALDLSMNQRLVEKYLPSLLSFNKSGFEPEEAIYEKRLLEQPRILVAAPSNAAVDNLAELILARKFVDGPGGRYAPKMVRVGVGSKNKALDNISINQQVDNLIAEHKAKRLNKKAITQTLSEIKVHLRAAAVRIRKLTEQYKQLRLNSSNAAQGAAGESAQVQASIEKARVEHEYHVVAAELCKCRADYSEYRAKLKQCEILDGSTPGYKKLGFRHKLAATVLESAAIIVTTLSASAMRDVAALGKKVRFSIVVVDEAAQSIEPSVLIPLQHGAEHCVLVGDPRQLPATVLSEHAKKHLLDQSLFERLQRNGCETHLLNTQYRCHPDIAAFPSQEFYGGKLRNGDNVFQRRLECYSRPAFGPLVFMNTNFGVASQGQGGGSWSNEQEARYVTRLYQSLKALHLQLTRQGGGVPLPKWRIGIITPYQQQLSLLRKFIAGSGSETDAHVPVVLGTVDGFQGQEFDIIIMSCVRAESATDEDARALAESLEVLNGGEGRRRNKSKYRYKRPSIGFLNDQRRLNVAMTRAKYSLVMVGQAQTLTAASPLWNRLLQCVQHNGRVFDIADAKVDPLQLV